MHLVALNELLDGFRSGSAYRVTAHIDPETVPRPQTQAELIRDLFERRGQTDTRRPLGHPVADEPWPDRELVLIGHIVEQPPARDAGLLISDAVNNLRAALDHAVWQLSIARTLPPEPIPRKGPGSIWRQIGWPITLDCSRWQVQSAQKLHFIEPTVQALFKPLQPFYRRPNDPEGDEFAVLDELWNVYKHRHLPLTEAWVGLEQVLSRMERWADEPGGQALIPADFELPNPFSTVVRETPEERARRVESWREALRQHSFTSISQHALGPFKDGAELGRVREPGPVYSEWPQMDVDPKLAVDVAFGPGAIGAQGRSVQRTLDGIRDEVITALKALESYF